MTDFQTELTRLENAGRYRTLRLRSGIDLSSNDYLGLSDHPELRRVAIEALEEGLVLGSGGSRLLSGHHESHARLEAFAAHHFDTARALYFATGFQANYALTTTLIARHDVAIFDALSHASLRDGLHAAHCHTVKVRHNDLDAFETALRRPRAKDTRAFVLVESVYSMDGDLAPLAELLRLCEKHDAILIVDEAHGTGVFGPTGKGVTEGLSSDRLIVLHTCGKALGVAGALVCASDQIIDYLINRARPFIYSTAPMPLQAVLTQKALEISESEGWRRERLAHLQAQVRARRPELTPQSPIVPIVLGEDAVAVSIAQQLSERGFDIRAIRPPTVPAGTARLRLSLNARLTDLEVDAFFDALAETISE